MPEAGRALVRTLNDPKSDVNTVSAVIAKDPALTVTLLRMANSAIFGLSRRVDTLEAAVSVVGMAQIRARALSICMANAMVFPAQLNRLEFWRSCMTTAGYARWLAVKLGANEHQAWLAGMMVRLGEIVIAQQHGKLIAKILVKPIEPGERWVRQRHLASFDEAQISAEIARRWDFPEAVVYALDNCAQPMITLEFSQLGGILHLASLLADHVSPTPATLDRLPSDTVKALGLDLAKLRVKMPRADDFSDISMLLD